MMPSINSPVSNESTPFLQESVLLKRYERKRLFVAVGAGLFAFMAYSCVYAYRKPFTVAEFSGEEYFGISYKTLLIICQGIGYMLSKFAGIRFIAELKKAGRLSAALLLVGASWGCLLLFAFVPAPYGIIFLVANGFFLGFLWGIIFSYLEGRKSTDFLGTLMAVSFIFAGGFTRSVGSWTMVHWGVSEVWMPFVTGLLFIIPFIVFLLLLEKVPAPDAEDIKSRTERLPMNSLDRKRMLNMFGPGLVVVTICYLFLTIMRDIRDNYMSNIWSELGFGNDYSIFATTETVSSLIVLSCMSMFVLVKRNISAFKLAHFVIIVGLILSGFTSLLYINDMLNGKIWMMLVGIGLYLGYILFNCIFFERMIAVFKVRSNIGFLIYLADAFGYLGSVTVMLAKEFMPDSISWSEFYSQGVVVFSLLAVIGTIYSYLYFNKKYHAINIR